VRLAEPGSSFVPEVKIVLRRAADAAGSPLRAGMTAPSVMDDGWWLTHIWVADEEGIVPATAVAPAAGPPPGAPLAALGPRLAGALSGLIAQEDERQMIRLRMPAADDESRPWERPLLCMLAVKWDPVRASVMGETDVARELLRGFAAAVEGVSRPG